MKVAKPLLPQEKKSYMDLKSGEEFKMLNTRNKRDEYNQGFRKKTRDDFIAEHRRRIVDQIAEFLPLLVHLSQMKLLTW